ncbi:hypothetical protein [Chitiniphilus eburneus]|uniref:Uncharacterized protein n=1 Tax=Chitiniphilus eburneus TaxID=2571148 RepID=A0A4U0Q4X6_9NEIS|nr:hypothetical protein [Chitiniphilus eburneus]TJZ76197.1 hypothetical protein FAZ21_05320 [Chitiniphilus eburneus]
MKKKDELLIKARVFALMRGREPHDEDFTWKPLIEKVEHIKNGSLKYLEIKPVYGAQVCVLAERITFENVSTLPSLE